MKTRMTLVLFAVFVLAGCTSVPVPKPEKNTLLVGKLLVNWDNMGGRAETFTSYVTAYFQNNQTEKVISVSTQKDGWLLTSKLNGGSYTIQKFYIEANLGGNKYTLTMNGPYYITIEEGRVNNIGAIQIDTVTDTVTDTVKKGTYSKRLISYDGVKLDFQTKFPASVWNSEARYEWKNTILFDDMAAWLANQPANTPLRPIYSSTAGKR